MKNNIRQIKEALLNPLKIFTDILGIELPSTDMPYISKIYKSLNKLMKTLFSYELFEDDINEILDSYFIFDDALDSMDTSTDDGLWEFATTFKVIQEKMNDLHIKICESISESSNGISLIRDMYNIVKDVEIDCDDINDELKELSIDKKTRKLLSYLISQRLMDITLVIREFNKKNKEDNVLAVYRNDKHDLVDNVNSLDKSSGVRLKHPKETIDDEYHFNSIVHEYRSVLTKLVLILNGIDFDNYIRYSTMFGEEIRKLKINGKFIDMSVIFKHDFGTSDFVFRCKFITYIMSWAIKKLDIIAEMSYSINNDGPWYMYYHKVSYVENVVLKLSDLICKMLAGCDCKDELFYFMTLQICLDNDENKKNMRKINNLYEQTEYLSYKFRSIFVSADSVDMDTLLKLSYMTSTVDNKKVRNIISMNDDYRSYKHKMAKSMIEELGRQICSSIDSKKMPAIFKFYIKSDPDIYSRWSDVNENKYLSMGIVAMRFYGFITCDKKINRQILRIVER